MKTALAIVCSLMLIGTLFVPASASAAGGACPARSCCSDCSQAACCTAKTPPEPLPVSAAPVPPAFQHQLLVPSFGASAWTLPAAESQGFGTGFSSPPAAGASLFARHCSRLI